MVASGARRRHSTDVRQLLLLLVMMLYDCTPLRNSLSLLSKRKTAIVDIGATPFSYFSLEAPISIQSFSLYIELATVLFLV